MVAAIVARFEVRPGRREEFIEALGEAKKVAEGRGANVSVRATSHGGEASGRLSRVFLFDGPAARAEFMDQGRESQQPGAIQAVLQTADPAATLVTRYWLNEVNPQPDGDIPAAPNVLATSSFRIAPGHSAEANATLMAAKSLWESLGVSATIWQLVNAGANSGLRGATSSYESFSAQADFEARLRERNEGGPGPLARAVQSGTLELVNQTVSTLVEV